MIEDGPANREMNKFGARALLRDIQTRRLEIRRFESVHTDCGPHECIRRDEDIGSNLLSLSKTSQRFASNHARVERTRWPISDTTR